MTHYFENEEFNLKLELNCGNMETKDNTCIFGISDCQNCEHLEVQGGKDLLEFICEMTRRLTNEKE